jgi:hypothetical protein
MNFLHSTFHLSPLLVAPVAAGVFAAAQNPSNTQRAREPYPPALVQTGNSIFQQSCAFCYRRDARG